ncbi:MAG TPA: response regulator [Candidatus Saccharimonadales bacterium]|nr:response regulator [Candidatus Saccharimonadales bacterium]
MKNTSILIVEDDSWLSEQFSRMLKNEGYDVTVVSNALAAIEKIDDINPDVIILDVLLTGSTAFALLHELQSYGDTGSIPVILCTNLASELKLEDLEPYGVKRILDKTLMVPDDLVVSVRSVLP